MANKKLKTGLGPPVAEVALAKVKTEKKTASFWLRRISDGCLLAVGARLRVGRCVVIIEYYSVQ